VARNDNPVRKIWLLGHQMLATQDIAKDISGAQLNWTYAQGGLVRNQIPERAQAIYAELDGRKLLLHPMTGGGTDAGYASLSGKQAFSAAHMIDGY
jgi:hypothetical protein